MGVDGNFQRLEDEVIRLLDILEQLRQENAALKGRVGSQEAQQEAREDVVVILVAHVGLLLLLAAQVVPEGGIVTRLGKRRRRRRAVSSVRWWTKPSLINCPKTRDRLCLVILRILSSSETVIPGWPPTK